LASGPFTRPRFSYSPPSLPGPTSRPSSKSSPSRVIHIRSFHSPMSQRKLPHSYYRQPDVVTIAQNLLGMVLCTRIEKQPLTSGIITETEAYCGRGDQASHADGGRRTARTETMYR